MLVGRHLILEKIATVDGRNWANQLRWVVYLLYPIILVVQEFSMNNMNGWWRWWIFERFPEGSWY